VVLGGKCPVNPIERRITMETTWSVVQKLGLVVEEPEPEQCLVYGSSDPYPNPAEFLLTQLVAKRHQLGWQFFTYRNGKNLPVSVDPYWVNPPGIFNLETIVPKDLTLGEIAQEIWWLRKEPSIIAHLPGRAPLRATSEPERKWPREWASYTIHQLHEAGGWFGGSSIHFLLRLWAEEREWVLYICPFQEKGRVYDIYRGFKRPLFVPTPFMRFAPPSRLGLPEWAPAPWSYWLSLPAAFRRRVRKEVKKRIWFGERRIEIPLP
jgi:hypothetical protein